MLPCSSRCVERRRQAVFCLLVSLINDYVSKCCVHRQQPAVITTPCPGKRDRQYFGQNFDKFKCTVVIFCKEYHEGNAKLPTQQNSASPNQCRYFTLWIRQWPCIAKHSHNWQLQLNQTGLAICVQVFDWSTTVRKVVVIAENTMSKSKTVLEMTAAGLDAPWETTTSLMHSMQLQWRRDTA